MIRKIYYTLSPSLRLLARRIFYLPGDILRHWMDKNKMVPPKGLIYTGSGDFIEVGKTYRTFFIQYAGLRSHHHVLDVGCGIGRMAVALTGYLNKDARYDGFDIVQQGVRWCQKHITPRYPNFHFRHVPLKNDLYTASGKEAQHFAFPYPDLAYDRVIVISVFTHMMRAEVGHYLAEIHRTLKEKGVAFVTFFLLNDISRKLMKEQSFRFDYDGEGCYLMDSAVRSANVAYDEADLVQLLTKTGFRITQTLYGKWSGRTEGTLDFQDIIILEKLGD